MGAGGVSDLRKSQRFLLNFPLGIFLGTSFTLLFVWILVSDLSPPFERVVAGIFGAIAGLIAAFLALAGVLTNIANQNHLAEKQRRRKLVAAKAVLPLVLSQMAIVARRGAEISIRQNIQPKIPSELIAELTLSKEVIATLQATIEQTDRQDGNRLANLVRRYQVCLTKTARLIARNDFAVRVDCDLSLSWVILFRLVEDCFEYSRGEASNIPEKLNRPKLRAFYEKELKAKQYVIDTLQPIIDSLEADSNVELFVPETNSWSDYF